MTTSDPNAPVPDPVFCERPVLCCTAFDWYDGPLAGVMLLGNPDEGIGFDTVALRYNSKGLDVRLAWAWPIDAETVRAINADTTKSCAIAFFTARESRSVLWLDEHCGAVVVRSMDGSFVGEARLGRPERPDRLISFCSGRHLLAAWTVDSMWQVTTDAMRRVLAPVVPEE